MTTPFCAKYTPNGQALAVWWLTAKPANRGCAFARRHKHFARTGRQFRCTRCWAAAQMIDAHFCNTAIICAIYFDVHQNLVALIAKHGYFYQKILLFLPRAAQRLALPAGARTQDYKFIQSYQIEARPAPVGCTLC